MLEIVRAKLRDAEALSQIAQAAKRHWGYPESWIAGWRDILTISPEFIAENQAWCAVEGADTLGFYVLARERDGLHLDHLWIKPAAMGRGIGRALFQHAVTQAKAAGFATIHIEADPNAEGFYERMGAKRFGTRITEIEGERRELPLLVYSME